MLELFYSLGMPEIASAHGQQLDDMLAWVHWLMALLFVGWGSFFIYTLIRFRESKNPVASYEGTKSHASSWGEFGVVLAEAALLVVFALPLWAERVNEYPDEKEATLVRVVAEQFAWNVHYPGKDGVFGKTDPNLIDKQVNPLGLDKDDPYALDDITNVNQLHLPVNTPALIHLTTKDVIHSFGVPEFRIKQDTIPGMKIPMWFEPTITTEEIRKIKGDDKFNYEIACAQLCGIGHARMRGFVIVDSKQGFQEWLDQQEPTLGSGDGEEVW